MDPINKSDTSDIKVYSIIGRILCKCGCGNEISTRAKNFIRGHNANRKFYIIFLDLCLCGCGNIVYGNHKYISGHNAYNTKQSKETIEKRMKIVRGQKWKKEQKENLSKVRIGINKGIRLSTNTEFKKGQLPSPKSSWSKGSYYDSKFQGKVWMRSPWEIEYAKYLDNNYIYWFYEYKTFDLGNTTYTPDFYLPEFEKFVEIKGYISPKSQEKINLFLEQYPWDLEILEYEQLKLLGCDL
jgi:hypothetical protein